MQQIRKSISQNRLWCAMNFVDYAITERPLDKEMDKDLEQQ